MQEFPQPDAIIELGTLHIERHGSGGTPLIFIPGLAGGAWIWAAMLRRVAPAHSAYALTLAGFSGRPPQPPPIIDKVVADIARFIVGQRLQRPVLIGHSLGAFIAFRIGIEHPGVIGGLIAVDGFPVFSSLADADEAARRAAASKLADELTAGKSPPQFHAAMHAFLTARMNDPAQAAQAAELAARSDPQATAHYIMEMLSADLRPSLARLDAPVLALVAANSYKNGLPEPDMRAFYGRVLANAPSVSIALIRNARHFAMLDQPQLVSAAIDGFLAGRGAIAG